MSSITTDLRSLAHQHVIPIKTSEESPTLVEMQRKPDDYYLIKTTLRLINNLWKKVSQKQIQMNDIINLDIRIGKNFLYPSNVMGFLGLLLVFQKSQSL